MKSVLFLKKISDTLDNIIMKVVFLSIVGMILSITMQIVFRVFFDALTWSEEISRYLLVWATFLGATLAYKRGMHISVTLLVDFFKGNYRKLLVVASIISSLIFFVVVVIFGVKYMSMQSAQVSAALRIPMRWVYLVIPVSFSIMTIHGITGMLEEIFHMGEDAK